jgi:TRAP-type C4-dicarboxylate transport system permease small subunit
MTDPQPPALPPRSAAAVLFVKLPYVTAGCLVLIAIAVNFANVIARYVFASAIFWTEEVLVYLISWSVFLAGVWITYRGEHITMDLFSSRLKGAARYVVNGTIATVFAASCVFVVVQSFEVVSLHFALGTRSVAAGVPMWIPHTALLVGFGLMALAVLVRVRAYLRGRFE